MTDSAPLHVVLDTNVVLDWLVFADARCQALVAAVQAGNVAWLATAAMRVELADVLARPFCAARAVDPAVVLAHWDRWATVMPPARPASPARTLHCTDPDDQIFIDLAIGARARWLVTRDRALLSLARTARAHGVAVLRPDDWRPAA